MTTIHRGGDWPAEAGAIRATLADLVASGVERLGEEQLRAIFSGVVPFGRAASCVDAEVAVRSAEGFGYPVVVKLLADGVLHKSELGLVRVDLRSAEEVRQAASDLLRRAAELSLANPVLSVQAQIVGVEMALGLRRDPLGAVCMVAAGGTSIEIQSDVAIAMSPLTDREARRRIDELRISRALEGFRGSSAVDVAGLTRLFVRVAELADAAPELAELDLNPVFVSAEGCLVVDAKAIISPPPETSTARGFADLRAVMAPSRIAVIGASTDERKVGSMVVRYLRKHGFPGEVITVNPRGDANGTDTVHHLSDIVGPIDLACIAVPAESTQEVVEDCVAQGVRGAVVYSAGFRESGESGHDAQDSLLQAAAGRLPVIGPNSIGIAVPGSRMFATFGMALESGDFASGGVGFVSQSGAIASSLFSRSREVGVGFSHWISVGNEADVGVEDFVAYLAGDPACEVICLFLEVIRRPAAFAEAAALAHAAGKPLIALKTGLTEAGRAAAASHTGALTGSDAAYRAFFDRQGVIRVGDLEDLLAAAQGAVMARKARGRRVGIVSMSGGVCSLVADACIEAGLEVPTFDAPTQARLREIIPIYGGVRNPVDVTATGIWRPELVAQTVAAIAESGAVDIVLVQLSTNADPAARRMATDLIELREKSSVPVLVGRLGSATLAPLAMQTYRQAGLHVFTWPRQLVRAAAAGAQAAEVIRSRQAVADVS